MKRTILISLIFSLTVISGNIRAQYSQEEYLGLPGDNLNLYAVMKLFQESETLEAFERNLNDEKNGINNLDLNGDNLVDYIMVADYVDGNAHNIVLRVALSAQETQDVAVFTVEKFSDGTVQIQLIGDEALYGKNYIVEPVYSDAYGETPNPGYLGSYRNGNRTVVYRTNQYVIADWPLIRYIFLPDYIGWHSPWYWGCSFSWWSPWSAWSWHYYYGYHSHWFPHYSAHFRMVNHYRYANYNNFYYHGIRSWSNHVNQNIREGRYRSTYSHPEQRREGEARFARNYSERNRDSRNFSDNSSGRRNTGETVRRQQNQTGAGYNQGRNRADSGNGIYSGNNSSSARSNMQSGRPESSVSRQRSVQSATERNTSIARRSANVPEGSGNNRYSSGNVRNNTSETEAPVVSRGSSGRVSSSGALKSASGSSRGQISSSARSTSNPSGSFSSRSSGGQSRSSISSGSSGGQSRSSVSSRSSGGQSRSSVSSRSSGGGSRSSVSSHSSGGSRSSGGSGSSGGSRSGGSSRSSRR